MIAVGRLSLTQRRQLPTGHTSITDERVVNELMRTRREFPGPRVVAGVTAPSGISSRQARALRVRDNENTTVNKKIKLSYGRF